MLVVNHYLSFSPSPLSLPYSLANDIRSFSDMLRQWLERALEGLPESLQEAKYKGEVGVVQWVWHSGTITKNVFFGLFVGSVAEGFANSIKRQTALTQLAEVSTGDIHQLLPLILHPFLPLLNLGLLLFLLLLLLLLFPFPQVTRNTLQTNNMFEQLREDWAAIDLLAVYTQILYVLQPLGIPQHYQQIIPTRKCLSVCLSGPVTMSYTTPVLQEFNVLLDRDADLEQILSWVDHMLQRTVKKVRILHV